MSMAEAGSQNGREIFISAGELSGDLIGSLLIAELLKLDPTLRITGLGGERMEAAGATIRHNMVKDLAIIGFAEAVTKYPKIRAVFKDTVKYLREHRPAVLVLIDYPGFNLGLLAEQAHKLEIKVVYYVCPQVWAWHKSRINKIRKFVDKALVILPFEEAYLRNGGVDAEFVGTPWLDLMTITMNREQVFEHFGLDPAKRLVGLLPGSRRREVESLLPTMLEAAEKIYEKCPDVQFVIPRATTVRREIVEHLITLAQVPVKVVESYRYNVRAALDLAIVASGTATLETGLLGTPMIIVYKVAYLSWLIGKSLVKIPYIGLINIVAGDMIAPELIQEQCTPQNVADSALAILTDPREVERVKYQLGKVKEKMGGRGASERAAKVVLDLAEKQAEFAKSGQAEA
ncbi:lipid-A-disaccharide synthase [bacterium]|nr:lipid-A-disaccharide synthase [bacterium]